MTIIEGPTFIFVIYLTQTRARRSLALTNVVIRPNGSQFRKNILKKKMYTVFDSR